MSFFPPNESQWSPFVWLTNLDEGAGFTRSLKMSLADAAEWQQVYGSLTLFELGAWRAMNTFQPSVPWRLAWLECGFVWSSAYGVLIPQHSVAAKLSPTKGTARLDDADLAGDDFKWIAADDTGLRDAIPSHLPRITNDAMLINGTGTLLAELDDAYDRPIRDLFQQDMFPVET